MDPGPLSHGVASLCQEVGPRLAGTTRDAVRDVQRRLAEPLRVAVAGRLKAGKSTLVNALIGRRVAPTEVGECTRIVTQFRYGTSDRVHVVRRDGSMESLPLDGSGMIPRRLGVPREEVSYVDVTLTSDRLQALTVVDTPGLGSINTQVSAGTEQFLFSNSPIDDGLDTESQSALGGAEAILYVFTQVVREDDVEALAAFRAISNRLSSSPINSVGLFNKVDKLGEPGDPWPVAGPLAASQAEVLRRQVADVVPVIGLLAETTAAGRLTMQDCGHLAQLAGLPVGERAVLMASVDLFTSRECAVPRDARQRLLDLLDLYGIQYAIDALTVDPTTAPGELIRQLFAASGFERARQLVDQVFRWRSDALKAGRALARLDHLAARADLPADREVLRDAVERLVERPGYHRLRLLEVAQQVSTGAVTLPSAMEAELGRLALFDDPARVLNLAGAPPARLAQAALESAGRWRGFAVADATPSQARVAHVVHRGFFLLSQQIRATARV